MGDGPFIGVAHESEPLFLAGDWVVVSAGGLGHGTRYLTLNARTHEPGGMWADREDAVAQAVALAEGFATPRFRRTRPARSWPGTCGDGGG